MKIYILSTDPSPELIKAWDIIMANGHTPAESLRDADIILVGPDLKHVKFNFIDLSDNEMKSHENFSNYKNWIARTFEGY